jgi:hypothetical protein
MWFWIYTGFRVGFNLITKAAPMARNVWVWGMLQTGGTAGAGMRAGIAPLPGRSGWNISGLKLNYIFL